MEFVCDGNEYLEGEGVFAMSVRLATPKGLRRTPPVRLWLSWPGRRLGASTTGSVGPNVVKWGIWFSRASRRSARNV